jgi:hypothetical protein
MVSEFLSSELLILNLVARSLAPVFLYGASTVGYTKAVAAEHGGGNISSERYGIL